MNDIYDCVKHVVETLEKRLDDVVIGSEITNAETMSVLLDGFFQGIRWLSEHPIGEYSVEEMQLGGH